MVLTRSEYIDYWNKKDPGVVEPDGVMWFWESESGVESQWFTWTDTIVCDKVRKNPEDFYQWCNQFLQGSVTCYHSHKDKGEWWGFTQRDDIVLWALKWI